MKPSLLIAAPQMTDPFFERSVVLVWHHDEDGAIGVIVNRSLEEATDRGVMPQTASASVADVLVVDDDDDVDLSPYQDRMVHWGGPVDTDCGTLLTTEPVDDDEGWNLGGGLSVTRSQDVLFRLVRDRAPLMLCLGYAGWGPGQLDQEIADGSWLFTDPHPDLVFDHPDHDVWERAIRSLGIDPAWLVMTPGEA